MEILLLCWGIKKIWAKDSIVRYIVLATLEKMCLRNEVILPKIMHLVSCDTEYDPESA